MAMLRITRLRTLALLTLTVLVLASAATAGQTRLYAKGVRVCKPAVKANQATCLAMKRVFVKAGTPGAVTFHPAVMSAARPGVATIGPKGGLTPGDLWAAYQVTTGATAGSGQTVAIVDAYNDPKIAASLATFSTHYGLSSCTTGNGCLKIVNQSGAASPLPANDTTGWSVEETLDVEAVHAICQGCKIVLVEANNGNLSTLGAAENAAANTIHATEISNSFGGTENSNSTLAAEFNHPGIVITASSGDNGYYSWDNLTNGGTNRPWMPAAFPTVVSVGGTGLYLNQGGIRQNELAWNDDGPQAAYELAIGAPLGASGSGCSHFFTAPGWQTHVPNWSATGCGTKRLDNDVSALADPLTGFDIYDSYTCASGCPKTATWTTVGGTSLAAPIVAAIFALAGGAQGVPYPALTLYGHMSSAYDVTVGGSGYCDGEGAPQCTAGGTNPNLLGFGVVDCAWSSSGAAQPDTRACDAAPGYDGPSGVGAPNGMTMFTKTGPNFTISGAATATQNVSQSWSAASISDPFPGGSVSTSTGCSWAWGDGSHSLNTTCTPTAHTYTSTGTKTITLTVTDSYGITTAKTLMVTVS